MTQEQTTPAGYMPELFLADGVVYWRDPVDRRVYELKPHGYRDQPPAGAKHLAPVDDTRANVAPSQLAEIAASIDWDPTCLPGQKQVTIVEQIAHLLTARRAQPASGVTISDLLKKRLQQVVAQRNEARAALAVLHRLGYDVCDSCAGRGGSGGGACGDCSGTGAKAIQEDPLAAHTEAQRGEPRFTARVDDEGHWFVWDAQRACRVGRGTTDRHEAEVFARGLNEQIRPASQGTEETDHA